MCWLEPQVEPTRLAEISRAEEANQKDTGNLGFCVLQNVDKRLNATTQLPVHNYATI